MTEDTAPRTRRRAKTTPASTKPAPASKPAAPGKAAAKRSRRARRHPGAPAPGALPVSTSDAVAEAPQDGLGPWDSSPSRYIARISRSTRRELLGPIEPHELLVSSYRDRSPVDMAVQYLASRLIEVTGKEAAVLRTMKIVNVAAEGVASGLGTVLGSRKVERRTKELLGVTDSDVMFQFREISHLSDGEVRERIAKLRREAKARLKARGRNPRLVVLLTGATGFLGKEILFQVAKDRRVSQVVAVLRPEKIRDHKTREIVKVLSPAERGAVLLERIGISDRKKFRFVGGDIEEANLGIAPKVLKEIRKSITHVVHCAASVSFDDTYDNSFRANVLGCRNALEFSLSLQKTPGSQFVHHTAIETSYVHGRRKRSIALESDLVFPRNFYNNYYELTKAMASIETDRFTIEKGLRVVQLLPSIVIGQSDTGNNWGDTKVVNAPVNAFGRARDATSEAKGDIASSAKARLAAAIALSFPGNRSAELNLIPVDRVVAGILASLGRPEAIGERVHLATDDRIRSKDIVRIAREEIGIDVRLVDPTVFRNLRMPVIRALLKALGEPRLADALDRLGSIFGSYGEWGQPVHGVGNDVRILGLPLRRPDTAQCFRMLCRHNEHVQKFGKVRDQDEVARREKVWREAIARIELRTGRQVAALRPHVFRAQLAKEIEPKAFVLRDGAAA